MTTNPDPQIQIGDDSETEVESRQTKHEEHKLRRREQAAQEERESAEQQHTNILAQRAKKADRLSEQNRERAAANQEESGRKGTKLGKKFGRLFRT